MALDLGSGDGNTGLRTAGVRLAAPSPAAPSLAAFPLPLCRTAPDKEEYGSEPGRFTSDSSRAVFQRTRELEDKLEAQRRHLKELEEKVGGRAGFGPPSGAVSVESFLLPARNAPRAASVSGHPTPPSAPAPHIGTSETQVTASSTFPGKKRRLGSTLSAGCGAMSLIFTKDLP